MREAGLQLMKAINFNDTADYQFMEILGVQGVFTPLRINRETLPEGFMWRKGSNYLLLMTGINYDISKTYKFNKK